MSRHPCIAVIDDREFRRTGLTRLLEPWASVEKIKVVSFNPEQVQQWSAGEPEFKMLIFGIGGDLLSENKTLRMLELLRSRAPDAPLVLISDREDGNDVATAMSKGVQGYIFSGISSSLAFQALSFILHGGIYFPPSALRKYQSEAKELNGGMNRSPEAPHREMNGIPVVNGAFANLVPPNGHIGDEDYLSAMLTARQREVLEHIRLGESNKVIGRALGMTEGTVKVHVRQIMRKAGATNRTQLAVGRTAVGRTSNLKKLEI